MEVLSSLLAERYERRSVMITSNLVFPKWNQIFHDDMTVAAAIDRVVHHSVILELTVPGYRAETAKTRIRGEDTRADYNERRREAGRVGKGTAPYKGSNPLQVH